MRIYIRLNVHLNTDWYMVRVAILSVDLKYEERSIQIAPVLQQISVVKLVFRFAYIFICSEDVKFSYWFFRWYDFFLIVSTWRIHFMHNLLLDSLKFLLRSIIHWRISSKNRYSSVIAGYEYMDCGRKPITDLARALWQSVALVIDFPSPEIDNLIKSALIYCPGELIFQHVAPSFRAETQNVILKISLACWEV